MHGNTYLAFFRIWFLLTSCIYGRLKLPFSYLPCPAPIIVARSTVFLTIRLTSHSAEWVGQSEFRIKMNGQIEFIYNPYFAYIIMDNQRFTVIRKKRTSEFILMSKFKNEDSGHDVEYGYATDIHAQLTIFCVLYVSPDMTPFATLTRQASPMAGVRSKKVYMEGEFVLIICRISYMRSDGTFRLVFPKGSKIAPLKELYHMKMYLLELKKNIKGRNISCIVPNGISAWSSELTTFVDLPKVVQEESRVSLAFTLSFMFCMMNIAITILGVYMLIFGLRKKETQQKVKHFAKALRSKPTYLSRTTQSDYYTTSCEVSSDELMKSTNKTLYQILSRI